MSKEYFKICSDNRVAGFLLISLSMCGCDMQAPEPESALTGSSGSSRVTATSSVPQDTPPVGPELKVMDEQQFAKIIEQHRGEVVLVDFWATWCSHCLELMPHAVELQKGLSDLGLHVILVRLDSPEDHRDAVEQQLANNGVSFVSYISAYGGDAKSAEAFEIEEGALPNIKLYDRKGKLRKIFSAGLMPPDPFDAEDVAEAVRGLLSEE